MGQSAAFVDGGLGIRLIDGSMGTGWIQFILEL